MWNTKASLNELTHTSFMLCVTVATDLMDSSTGLKVLLLSVSGFFCLRFERISTSDICDDVDVKCSSIFSVGLLFRNNLSESSEHVRTRMTVNIMWCTLNRLYLRTFQAVWGLWCLCSGREGRCFHRTDMTCWDWSHLLSSRPWSLHHTPDRHTSDSASSSTSAPDDTLSLNIHMVQ